MFASGFSWAHLIMPALGLDSVLEAAGLATDTHIVYHAWLAAFALIVFSVVARMGLEKAKKRQGIEKYFADEKFSALTLAEVLADGWLGLMRDLLSRADAKLFFPLVAGLFTYIFTNNIMSVIPGFLPATDNANTNIGMAVIVFVVFNFVGLKRDAVGYIKHMMGPVLLLAAPLLVLESFSLMVRMGTLTLRLTGNMFGDHTVFNVMSSLVGSLWFIPVPIPFLGLAIFVSFMQAFVFSLLTAVYIAGAVPHHDDEHH